MKNRFIHSNRTTLNIAALCRLLHVSRSAYYRWQRTQSSARQQRDNELLALIRTIHRQSQEVYGSPRIHAELRKQGILCGRKRVARLMRQNGLRAKMVRRFKVTTRSRRGQRYAPDLVQRDFAVRHPNRVWTSDITYIWTREGWAYLAVVLDLGSRMVVGWEFGARLTSTIVTAAVSRAIHQRRPSEGLILHSDRGSQYASEELQTLATDHALSLSMGRTGSCYDNAVTESFFHTLKTEHVYWHKYQTRDEARTSIFDYIEIFYNRKRRHSTIGYCSPVEYEQQLKLP
jgi:putative transposase